MLFQERPHLGHWYLARYLRPQFLRWLPFVAANLGAHVIGADLCRRIEALECCPEAMNLCRPRMEISLMLLDACSNVCPRR
jgi:hypothetical protein